MKKLIVAAVIAVTAVVTQAATVSWTLTGVQKGGENVSGTMYFLTDTDISRSSILALAGGGATAMKEALAAEGTHAFKWTVSDGTGTMTNTDAKRPSNADLGLSDTTGYNFYAVIFDTDEITEASNFFVTALKSASTMSGTSNKVVGLGAQTTASNAKGAWNAVAAPEPTSGLLLLLGMAGLALRRRRS